MNNTMQETMNVEDLDFDEKLIRDQPEENDKFVNNQCAPDCGDCDCN